MYVPAHFAAAAEAVVVDLIAGHGFATLVSNGPDGLTATHVPVQYDRNRGEKGALLVHLSRSNPHAAQLDGQEMLAIFTGPHGYVSPSWYRTHPAVPTWNYAAVHVHGRARRVDDAAGLRDIVGRLVDQYESGRPQPWSMGGLPADYMDRMLKAIVGFEIAVTRIEGKLKLSQNRRPKDRRSVIAALHASQVASDRELAECMARHAPA
jgi:transcriptional regulator